METKESSLPKKDLGGRPTKYKKEYADIALDYINQTAIPYKEELCVLYDVWSDKISKWAHKHKEFRLALKKLEDKQKLALMSKGLQGTVNTAMSIFLLKANHGLMETDRRELTGKDGEKLTGVVVEFVEKKNETEDTSNQRPEADTGSGSNV